LLVRAKEDLSRMAHLRIFIWFWSVMLAAVTGCSGSVDEGTDPAEHDPTQASSGGSASSTSDGGSGALPDSSSGGVSTGGGGTGAAGASSGGDDSGGSDSGGSGSGSGATGGGGSTGGTGGEGGAEVCEFWGPSYGSYCWEDSVCAVPNPDQFCNLDATYPDTCGNPQSYPMCASLPDDLSCTTDAECQVKLDSQWRCSSAGECERAL
jgi:hypothetical protein